MHNYYNTCFTSNYILNMQISSQDLFRVENMLPKVCSQIGWGMIVIQLVYFWGGWGDQ